MTRNKWLVTVIVFIGMVAFGAANVIAAPKLVAVDASADDDGNVTLSAFPQGATLVNIHIWNDCEGSPQKEIGPKLNFKLNPCDGFNFLWRDANGKVWYQLITPNSKAGGSLEIDDSYIGASGRPECKYIYRGGPRAPRAQRHP